MSPLPRDPQQRQARSIEALLSGIRNGDTFGQVNAIREIKSKGRAEGTNNLRSTDQ